MSKKSKKREIKPIYYRRFMVNKLNLKGMFDWGGKSLRECKSKDLEVLYQKEFNSGATYDYKRNEELLKTDLFHSDLVYIEVKEWLFTFQGQSIAKIKQEKEKKKQIRKEKQRIREQQKEIRKKEWEAKRKKFFGRKSYDEYIESSEWGEIRWKILKERGFICQCCGVLTKRVEIHHIHYNNFKNERPEDLLVLDTECHKWMHLLVSDPPFNVERYWCELELVSNWLFSDKKYD